MVQKSASSVASDNLKRDLEKGENGEESGNNISIWISDGGWLLSLYLPWKLRHGGSSPESAPDPVASEKQDSCRGKPTPRRAPRGKANLNLLSASNVTYSN